MEEEGLNVEGGRRRVSREGKLPQFMYARRSYLLTFPPFSSSSLLFPLSLFPPPSHLKSPILLFLLPFFSLQPPFSPLISLFPPFYSTIIPSFSLFFVFSLSSSPSSPCDSWVVRLFTLDLSSSSIRLFSLTLVRAIEVGGSRIDYP